MVAFRCRGRGGRIRTGGLLLPKQAICQTDLRPASADGTRRRWAGPAATSSADHRWSAGLRPQGIELSARFADRGADVLGHGQRATDDDDVRRIESPELGCHRSRQRRARHQEQRPVPQAGDRAGGQAIGERRAGGHVHGRRAVRSERGGTERGRRRVPVRARARGSTVRERCAAWRRRRFRPRSRCPRSRPDQGRAAPARPGSGREREPARDEEQRRAGRGGHRAGGEGIRIVLAGGDVHRGRGPRMRRG